MKEEVAIDRIDHRSQPMERQCTPTDTASQHGRLRSRWGTRDTRALSARRFGSTARPLRPPTPTCRWGTYLFDHPAPLSLIASLRPGVSGSTLGAVHAQDPMRGRANGHVHSNGYVHGNGAVHADGWVHRLLTTPGRNGQVIGNVSEDAAVYEPAPALHDALGEPVAFARLGVAEEILAALREIGYVEPMPVQREAIPLLLAGRDVVGQAQTGTGKTAAFGIPLVQQITPGEQYPQAIVLVPTRELAQQVRAELTRLGAYRGVRVVLLHGGAPMQPEVAALRAGADIVVGTPGRVMHHMRNGALRLDRVRFVILDEADEMLDVGFAEDIEWIMQHVPAERQTGLFSATIPPWVLGLIHRYMRDPVRVRIAPDQPTVETVTQYYALVAEQDKVDALRWLLAREGDGMRALIFCRRKVSVDWLAGQLRPDWPVMALHGDVPQHRRTAIVQKLRSGEIHLVIATNVAARGLDIPDLTHVINFDLPDTPEEYIHRIGRTARAGRPGTAISFVSEWDLALFEQIQRFVGDVLQEYPLPLYTVADNLAAESSEGRVGAGRA